MEYSELNSQELDKLEWLPYKVTFMSQGVEIEPQHIISQVTCLGVKRD